MRTSIFPAAKTHAKTFLLGCVVALGLSNAASAESWWKEEWTVRKKVTVDASASGAAMNEPIGSSAVLIRLHDGNFQFPLAKEDASDLRFVASDDKTVLPFHIEKFDPLLNEAFVWVKAPDLKPGEKTSFWLYYGNAVPGALKAEDAKATFDADTVLVYHFADRSAPADSTGNGNQAQNPGVPVEGSLIGGGVRFDGKNAITIPASESLAWADGGALTWSAWIKPATLQPNAAIFSRRDGANAVVIGLDNGVPFVEVARGGSTQRTAAGAPVAVNSWHHLAVVASGGAISLHLDGEQCGTLSAGVPPSNAPLLLGSAAEGNAGAFSGELDELEISKVARPIGFLKLAAATQGGGDKAGKALTLGEDQQKKGWLSWLEGGYFGVIVKSLTFDGWVVIGLLAIMAVVSWWVMISKVSYLNAISKGNALFMREWSQIANDLTVLDHGDAEKVKTLGGRVDKNGQRAMRKASVYRIYHIGAEEIRHRLARDQRAGAKVLRARSIQAIRASLDAGLVRETQKINRLIVLLTICISGGPFLGLLGTVVGVMITFAAVAAAGDVNVNAIAPGIAAALLATVAGLAVAIPSLFGYNYILSRVKDATADMHVFIDEFVTKLAEFYAGDESPAPVRQAEESAAVHA